MKSTTGKACGPRLGIGAWIPARRARGALAAIALGALTCVPRALAAQQPSASIAESIRALVAGLPVEPVVAGDPIRGVDELVALYARSGYAPLWSDASAAALRRATQGAEADGLDPERYHLRPIDELAGSPGGAAARARLDVLRTAALVALVHDLRWGRARPTSVPAVPPRADSAVLARLVGADDLGAEVRALRPAHFTYRGLLAALERLRAVERTGGWRTIPAGPTLRTGSTGERVAWLRDRLAAEDYLSASAGSAADFDAAVTDAVRSFQHHHGLNEDGAVGRATLAELNVPVAARIAQVRVNLERARWIAPLLPDTFVVVNIAGAKVYVVRDGAVVHEARAIVGRDYTRTPVFTSRVEQIVLNPTWTVPASIVDEVLDAVARDPAYLTEQGMRVLDRSGRPVSVSADELLRARGRGFPWTFRQDPGPLNPLGQLKLDFPNPFAVYLHDTPARTLFEREERLFSHGCIRVQDPLALAVLLLDDPERWSRAALEAEIAKGALRTIALRRPVFILVQYWTASADERGELHFYRDVYGRDPAILAALGR